MYYEGTKRNNLAARRRNYAADHPDRLVTAIRLWWLPAGARHRILRWRRHQPDYPDRDYSVVVAGHLRRRPGWGVRPGVRWQLATCKTATFPMSPPGALPRGTRP